MFTQLGLAAVPRALRGPVLLDERHIPRFWAAVWITMAGSELASGTLTKRLRQIESLYAHADETAGEGALDDALGDLDFDRLGDILQSWFVRLRNQPTVSNATELRWRTGFDFVRTVTTWLAKGPRSKSQAVEARLQRLATLYAQLHIRRDRQSESVRSLPSAVLETLYETLDPESATNPFKQERTRWRIYAAFTLLKNQGLRRGELLLLPVDVIKSGFDRKAGITRLWLNVKQNDYCEEDDDPRYSKPSIKTADSYRQLPVSPLTAKVIQTYSENFRGRPDHPFLFNAQSNAPLSSESLTAAFKMISAALPAAAVKELRDRTGKTTISPHDLRHTCAVVRLHQLLERSVDMPVALQQLRAFFGWSKESDMPLRYAKAVFEDRLATVWNDAFDERVAIVRSLPR
jgi:integrase